MAETDIGLLSSLLKSNGIPLDNEVDTIKVYLKQCHDEAAALDAAILELQRRRESLQQTIDRYEGLMHPLRRNLDVLQEIFLHCLLEDRYPCISAREAPILLTHVCRQWRNVALGMSTLWDTICITIPSGWTESANRQAFCHGLTTWLCRSDHRPLRIALYDAYPFCKSIRQQIIATLRSVAPRWQTLVVSGYAQTLAEFIDFDPQVRYLENLVIDMRVPLGSGHGSHNVPPALISGPALKRLCLHGVRAQLPSLPVHWANLSHISIDPDERTGPHLSVIDVLEILGRCRNILSARIHFWDAQSPDQVTSLVLPQLRYLSIFVPGPNASTFFTACRAPSLQEFAFQSAIIHSESAANTISEFIAATSLQHFTIHLTSFRPESLKLVLSACPALISLRACDKAFGTVASDWSPINGALNTGVLKSLTPAAGGGDYLCPRLTTLAVDNPDFSISTLLKFVDARLHAAEASGGQLPKLQTLIVKFTDGTIGHNDYKKLELIPEYLRSGILCRKPVSLRTTEQVVGVEALSRYPLFSATAEARNPLEMDNILFAMDS